MVKSNLQSKIFNRLTVIKENGKNKHGKILWLCICECGKKVSSVGSDLISEHTKSCGCLNIDLSRSRATKHGMALTSEYTIWHLMKGRCLNKKNKDYIHYGGRGIKICERWKDFNNFYIDMGKRPNGLTLERVDNNKGYLKENCRWATRKEQGNNQRTNRMITFNGEIRTLSQWSDILKIPYSRLSSRLNKLAWSVNKTFMYVK